MSELARNVIYPGQFNNYSLAGNLCNAFAIGNVGATDDFFLVGAEPPEESSYPLLTGTLLDSDGQVLFRLMRNTLIINPGDCSKIVGDHIGYEIHDSAGELVFKIDTSFVRPEGLDEPCFVTTLAGTFYDKAGNIVFRAMSGQEKRLEAHGKGAFGVGGSAFGIVLGLSEADQRVGLMSIATGGAINEVMTGKITGRTFDLDGKAILDAEVVGCTITVRTGRWVMRNSTVRENTFAFEGEAAAIRSLVEANTPR